MAKHIFTVNDTSWSVDPQNHFPQEVPWARIALACRVLPLWLSPKKGKENEQDPWVLLTDNYPYHMGSFRTSDNSVEIEFDQGTGIYRYPGDPPQVPLMRGITPNNICIYIYQASMVVVNYHNGAWKMTRVD